MATEGFSWLLAAGFFGKETDPAAALRLRLYIAMSACRNIWSHNSWLRCKGHADAEVRLAPQQDFWVSMSMDMPSVSKGSALRGCAPVPGCLILGPPVTNSSRPRRATNQDSLARLLRNRFANSAQHLVARLVTE